MQDFGADTLCGIAAFVGGAGLVALLTTDRRLRSTLSGPVARKHFQAMSIARWGEGCRCRYPVAGIARNAAARDGDTGVGGEAVDGVLSRVSSGSGASKIVRQDDNQEKGGKGCSDNRSNIGSSSSSIGSDVNVGGAGKSCNGKVNEDPNRGSDSKHDCGGGGDDGDWLAFYLRRVRHRPVWPSPLDLLQEHYTEDAYRLLSCCILCSRTSGGATVKDAVAAFFKACPTPTSVLAADQGELRQTLLPLGLNREVTIKRFAEGFLTWPWYDPSELPGCGRFASDSWQIFCLGIYRPGDQVIAAAVEAAAAAAAASTAVSSGSKEVVTGGKGDQQGSPVQKSGRKGTKRASTGRRGSLDRNLAAYCRFAERRELQSRELPTAQQGGCRDLDGPVSSSSSGGQELSGDIPAATALATKKITGRKRAAVSLDLAEGGCRSTRAASKKRGRHAKSNAPVSKTSGASTPSLRERRGKDAVPSRGAVRRKLRKVRGDASGPAVDGHECSATISREERALRRRRWVE